MTTKNMPDLSAMLNPRDRRIIDDAPATNWIPKDPRELLLPYIDRNLTAADRSSLEFRRRKAREVYDGYGKIIEQCKKLEDEIEAQCKNVVVTLSPERNLRAIEAVRRTFGTDGATITFEMYKKAVQAFSALSKNNIPNPADLLKKK